MRDGGGSDSHWQPTTCQKHSVSVHRILPYPPTLPRQQTFPAAGTAGTTGTTGTISKKQCQKKKIPNEPRNQMSVSNECFVGWLFNSTAQMGANKTQRRCVFVLVVCWMDARFGNFASGGVVMPSFCAVASCIPPNKEHFRVSTRSGRGKCQKEQRKERTTAQRALPPITHFAHTSHCMQPWFCGHL